LVRPEYFSKARLRRTFPPGTFCGYSIVSQGYVCTHLLAVNRSLKRIGPAKLQDGQVLDGRTTKEGPAQRGTSPCHKKVARTRGGDPPPGGVFGRIASPTKCRR